MQKEISAKTLEACIAGDPVAERAVYDSLLPYLERIARRYLRNPNYCQDVLQDAFLQLFRYLPSFQLEKGKLVSWATKITINVALKYNRKADPLKIRALSEEIVERYAAPPEKLEQLSDEGLLLLLRKMPNAYYTVFNLAVIEEYSHREIGQMLNITEVSSRKKLSRAKAWLRKRFETSAVMAVIPNAF